MKKSSSILIPVIYAGLSILLCRIPLFNALGYEFSVVIAIAASVITGFGTIHSLKRDSAGLTSVEPFFTILNRSMFRHLFYLLVPMVISLLNVFFVPNCSMLEGLLFFLLIPAITVVFSAVASGFMYVWFNRPGMAYTALLASCFVYPLVTGYFTPAVYSYNFIYGFFPGITYDEVIRITPQLLIARGVTVLVSLFLVVVTANILATGSRSGARLLRLKSIVSGPRRWSIGFLASILILIWFFRTDLGLESSTASILERLNVSIRTDHFVIHVAKGSFTEAELGSIAAEHEFRFTQILRELGTDTGAVFASFIYPDEETKRRYTGAGTTNIAKPWRREIHLNKSSWREVLKHELVHACAAEFGMPVIRAHYNIGLVEGLATAVDDQYGNQTLAEYGAGLKKFGLLKDPEKLMNPLGFARQFSSLSYVGMGSFCKHLLERHGAEKFKEMYGGHPAGDVYGSSLEQLASEWWTSLDAIPVPDTMRHHFNYYFNRPSIFGKVCARSIAAVNESGWKKLAAGNSVGAMERFSRSINRVWNTDGFTGLIRSAYQAGRYDTVIRLVQSAVNDSIRSGALQGLLLVSGDAYWYRGLHKQADSAFAAMRRLDLSWRTNEAVDLRRATLRDSSLCGMLAPLFTGDWSESAALTRLNKLESAQNLSLCRYLSARIHMQAGTYDEAIRLLEDPSMATLDPSLGHARIRTLGLALIGAGKYAEAVKVFKSIPDGELSGRERARLQENIRRSLWLQGGGSKYLRAEEVD